MNYYQNERETVIELFQRLGEVHLSRHKISVPMEKDTEPGERETKRTYCVADTDSQKLGLKIIARRHPYDAVIAEEDTPEEMEPFEGNNPHDRCWVLDSLDGSVGYLNKAPFFGVVVGFRHQDEFVLSGLYSTLTKTMYLAEKGKGVRKYTPTNPEGSIILLEDRLTEEDIPRPGDQIHVTGFSPDIVQRLNEHGRGISFQNVPNFSSIERTTQVLEGRHKAYLKNSGNIYGLGPESFAVEEAGGVFINLNLEKPVWHLHKSANGKRLLCTIDDQVLLGPPRYCRELAPIVKRILN